MPKHKTVDKRLIWYGVELGMFFTDLSARDESVTGSTLYRRKAEPKTAELRLRQVAAIATTRRRFRRLGAMNKLVTAALALFMSALSMSPTVGLGQEAMPLGGHFQMADLNRCLAKAGNNPRSCIGTLSNECQMMPNGSTTPGIVACEQGETELWDRLLNERYKAAMAATKERESDIQSFGGKPNASASLREAQRKWVAFRDAECQRVFEYYAAGTIRGPAFAGCQLRRTAERAIDFAPENFR